MLSKVFCDLCAVIEFTGNLPMETNLIPHSSPFDFLSEQTIVPRSVAGPVTGPSNSRFSRCEKAHYVRCVDDAASDPCATFAFALRLTIVFDGTYC